MVLATRQAKLGESRSWQACGARNIALLGALVLNLIATNNAPCQQTDINTDLSTHASETLDNIVVSLYQRGAPAGPVARAAPWPGVNYLMLALPLTFNTNPALVHSGATDSFRFDPKLQGKAVSGAVSVLMSADLDRYPNLSSANTNNLLGIGQLALDKLLDPHSVLAPFLLYQLSVSHSPSSSPETVTMNDLGAGSKINLSSWNDDHGTWQPLLSFNVTRRLVTSGTDSTSIVVKPWLTYTAKQDFDGSFSPSVRVRWFDSTSSGARRDTLVILPIQVGWYPDILCKFWDGLSGSLQVSVTATRDFSNMSSHSVRQWDIGPTIEFATFWGDPSYGCPKKGH